MAAAPKITLELAGREVSISNPEKVFFSKRGETKLDLIEYYRAIEEPLMKAMGGRPVLMQRFPDGASGKSFFQKRVPKGAPDWLQTTVVATPNGTTSNAMVAADIAHLAWAVNMGCLGFHGWPHTADKPQFTDELRVDLDPSKGISLDDIKTVAFQVREALDEVGIQVFPKTSGSRGLHLFAHLLP
ncbi:MAG: ATP-dependent DNA ligase, partial [Acidimicrobiia bacterium]|nr:ATP-dependent DNA ligase [Acidimicrobiia bacterium]